MIINIHQKKLSIVDQYKISINGVLKYLASSPPGLLPEILVMDAENNRLKIKMKKHLQWFKAKYDIHILDHELYCFNTISYFRSHFRCIAAGMVYDVYTHRGRKHSIFKDNKQIAWWEKHVISWLEGDQYSITADENSDANLLISFCLILDNYLSGNKGENLLTINWGYMGLQAKHFDENWQPSGS